ncbi:MAG: TlpA family protein disulfide reductase [Candidatus Thorarchaeota archaeon]
MEPEKLLLVGVTLAIVTVGVLFGASFLTLPTSSNQSSDDGDLTKTTVDTDLISLGLQVPVGWEFEMSDGSTLDLDNLRGTVIVVDLMATWCSSCATQNGYLLDLYDIAAGPVEIVSLSVDSSDTAAMMADYKQTKGLPWPHGLDTGRSFMNYFSVTNVPSLVIIDGDGYFRYFHVGLWTDAQMSQTIASVM